MSKRGPNNDSHYSFEVIDEHPKDKKKQSIKYALAEGSLLERIELEGENAKLVLKEIYNNPENYHSINKALYNLHKTSKAFQAKFEQPKISNDAPHLKLKPSHNYAKGQAVQDALISFASSKEKLNVRAALAEGSLLERVELDSDDAARLILKEQYNNPDYYHSVSQALCVLHKTSTAFQAKFEKPKRTHRLPHLQLKLNHGYVDGQAVQNALIGFASSSKEKLNVKEALRESSLLEHVVLDGENVKLILKEKYNNPEHYYTINKGLYALHRSSVAFQDKFKQPKQDGNVPQLKLKPNHGYAEGQAVQDALISFASHKETLYIKKALAEGSLLERVELEGDRVRLILKEKYNDPEHYYSINLALYTFYKASKAFQSKFKQPKQNNSAPHLKLKPNHDYVDGQAVQDALISFASSKKSPQATIVANQGNLAKWRKEMAKDEIKISDQTINLGKIELADLMKILDLKDEELWIAVLERVKDRCSLAHFDSIIGNLASINVDRALEILRCFPKNVLDSASRSFRTEIVLGFLKALLDRPDLRSAKWHVIEKEVFEILSLHDICFQAPSGRCLFTFCLNLAINDKFDEPWNHLCDIIELQIKRKLFSKTTLEILSDIFIKSPALPKNAQSLLAKLFPTLALLRDILPGINANKGTRNCVHCALQVDEYLKAGKDLGLGPVPRKKSDLLTYPIFKNGKIIRSTSENPSLVQRTTKPSPYRMICNLNDDTPVLQLDLTDEDSAYDPSEARFRKATIENLKEQLIDLPRSSVDGSGYGFILLTRKEDDTIGHLMNFFVEDDVVYLIDAQQPKEKQFMHNSEFQEMMKAFLPEIFFMQSIPPEGFALKIEERPIKVEEEIEAIEAAIDEQPKDKQKQSIIRAWAEGRLLERVVLDGKTVKLVLKEKYNNTEHYYSINDALYRLYETSAAFQAKFKRPKSSKAIPCLTLKSNHDYVDDKAVQDALMSFVSSKEKLNVREALMTGSLLERVVLDGESVKLVLKRKYNNPAHYVSINNIFYQLHNTTAAFQAKFEQPKTGRGIPFLKLKPNHGYANGQAVADALKNFASLKEKLNVKEALAEGNLLERVEFNGDSVRLLLKEEYNHPDYYSPINEALYGLHKTSPDFQAKFERPKKSYSAPCLKLKPNHGYAEGQAVEDALKNFASPKEQLNVKEALIEGSLLEHVELEDESVKLILKEKYNNPVHYLSINHALYYLHKTSTAFQAKFEQPKLGNNIPSIKLKSNHGYTDGQSVKDALISFASFKEKLNVKEALAEGSLLEGVELEGENVKLVLKGNYNNPAHYLSISRALCVLYKTSKAFQAKFEQPKQGNSAPPCLKLKPGHGYADGISVQNALISFSARKEQLNVKAALLEGSLLERVVLEGDKIRLILKEKFNNPDYYFSINGALHNLHAVSPAFRDKYEQPRQGKHAPCLELKPNHDYADGQAVQDALISFVSSKEKLNFKKALAEGSILEGVELDGKNVKLILKEKYNHSGHYLAISKALYFLHRTSTAFQAKFEQPKQGDKHPCLKLNPDHGYVDGQAVQDALISFVSQKEKLNVKAALAEGSLLERVVLEGDCVRLILKEKYNNPADYFPISQALCNLYKTSPAFQSKFAQPRTGKSAPSLKLKPNHGYADAQAVQDALMSFGLSKKARTKKTEVEVDSGEERTRVFLPGFKAVAKPTPTIFQNFEMKNKLTL